MSADLASAVATVSAYAAGAGVAGVVALLDDGSGEAAGMIVWSPEQALFVGPDGEERPPPQGGRIAQLPDLRPVPSSALSVDPEAGEISAPVGALAHMVDGLRALAGALGGRSAVMGDFATADAGVLLTLAVREGETVIASVGDDQFEVPGL